MGPFNPDHQTHMNVTPFALTLSLIPHRYDRMDNTFRKLVDVQFIAAMGPPGGGRNPVTNRYMRHFHVLHATEFDDASKKQVRALHGS